MICISIADVTAAEAKKIISENELCEVRIDKLKLTSDDIKSLFSIKGKSIATYRPSESLSESARIESLILAIESGAAYVDIEVETDDLFKSEIIKTAKKHGCRVITSYHNFVKTPVMRELEQILAWCLESSPDIAKIACQVNSIEDNARLLSIYSLNKNVISIGMGELGKITRIAATLLGAPFTYAAIDSSRKTAPGQIDTASLKKIINMISEA
ncbi:MAG TPA: type I 3-dehydroquinate dehydratase [Spirochaetota bacterium]|nr:type I 3-dehydroquinate dehydratase [Spirochaetota bacterium]